MSIKLALFQISTYKNAIRALRIFARGKIYIWIKKKIIMSLKVQKKRIAM